MIIIIIIVVHYMYVHMRNKFCILYSVFGLCWNIIDTGNTVVCLLDRNLSSSGQLPLQLRLPPPPWEIFWLIGCGCLDRQVAHIVFDGAPRVLWATIYLLPELRVEQYWYMVKSPRVVTARVSDDSTQMDWILIQDPDSGYRIWISSTF